MDTHTPLHIAVAGENGTSFDGIVEYYSKTASHKSMLVIPQQPDPVIYTAIIREAIKQSQCRIDVIALIVFEELPDNRTWRFIDYSIDPQHFVRDARVVEEHEL